MWSSAATDDAPAGSIRRRHATLWLGTREGWRVPGSLARHPRTRAGDRALQATSSRGSKRHAPRYGPHPGQASSSSQPCRHHSLSRVPRSRCRARANGAAIRCCCPGPGWTRARPPPLASAQTRTPQDGPSRDGRPLELVRGPPAATDSQVTAGGAATSDTVRLPVRRGRHPTRVPVRDRHAGDQPRTSMQGDHGLTSVVLNAHQSMGVDWSVARRSYCPRRPGSR